MMIRVSTITSSADRPGRRIPPVLMPLTNAFVFLAVLLPAVGMTQEPPLPAPGIQDRYQVEIIVFRHDDDAGSAAASTASATAPDAATTQGQSSDRPWTILAPGELQLGGTVTRLRRSSAYRLLYHGGWSEPVQGRARAIPFPMPPEARAAGVDGTITLYRERFLQVRVDLRLAADGANPDGATMQQTRRLRGQALQYFDDTRFGVILAARPVSETQSGATGTTPPQ